MAADSHREAPPRPARAADVRSRRAGSGAELGCVNGERAGAGGRKRQRGARGPYQGPIGQSGAGGATAPPPRHMAPPAEPPGRRGLGTGFGLGREGSFPAAEGFRALLPGIAFLFSVVRGTELR